jgi:TolA-binding protein
MRRALGLPLLLSFAGAKAAAVAWAQAAVAAVVAAGLVGTASSPPREPVTSPASAPADIRPTPPAVRAVPAIISSAVPAPAEEAKAPKRAPAPAPAPSQDVREEIRLLDHARAALLQHAPSRALERLAQYTQRFPRGALRQEAAVLRIEALRAQGDQTRAAVLAQEFLAKHPGSPHAERVTAAAASATPAR